MRELAIVAAVLGRMVDRVQLDVMDVGNAGALVRVDRFGAFAPGLVVLERYGFAADNVAARALEFLRTSGLSSLLGR